MDSLLDELPGKHPLPRVTLCPSNYTKYVTMRNKNMLTHKQVHSNVIYQFSSIQSLSYVQLFVTPWTATCQPSLSITNSRSLLIFLSIEPSNHLIFCHPFFCLQSWPASGSFPMNQFFASGGQSIGVSASASIIPMNIQNWFPLGWTGLISLQSKGLSRVFSNITVQKHQFSSFLYSPTLISILDYWKEYSFD